MSDDVLAITVPIAVVIIGAFLAYYFDSRKAREFSLIEKLWNLKREGYTEIEQIQMQLSQLPLLLEEMYEILRSDKAGLDKVGELISNVRLVENIHGVKTGVLEELLDLRKDFDQTPEAQMGASLSEKLEPIVETVSHKIEDGFIGLSQRSAKIIHGLYLITDDESMLNAAWDSLSNYYKLGDAIDKNSPDG
jgi:hypothetical protein